MSGDILFLVIANTVTICVFLYFSLFVFPRRPLSEETRKRRRTFISNALFREFWQFLSHPLKNILMKWNIHCNTVTVWGMVFSGFAGFGISQRIYGFAGWMLILASTCDMIDGQMARARNIFTKSGAYVDSTLDRLGEFLIALGFLWHFREEPTWFVLSFVAVAAAQMTSYARARAEGLGFKGDDGFFQRPERMIVMSIALPLTPFFHLATGQGEWMVKAVIVILFVGSVQTAFERWWTIFREMKRLEA